MHKTTIFNKKYAFTLAEVLITLMILGIIATIVIPSTISRVKKHETEVRLKQAYAIFTNVLKRSEIDNGPVYSWDYQTTTGYGHSEYVAKTYIFPYLNISKVCGSMNEAIGKCFPGKNGDFGIKTLDEETNYYTKTYYTALLANGMAIAVFSNWFENYIIFDINGPGEGNSLIGEDVFYFYTTRNQLNMSGIGAISPTWPTEVPVRDYTLSELLGTSVFGGCNKNGYAAAEFLNGSQCSAAIAKNGWKIPADYPVHF